MSCGVDYEYKSEPFDTRLPSRERADRHYLIYNLNEKESFKETGRLVRTMPFCIRPSFTQAQDG